MYSTSNKRERVDTALEEKKEEKKRQSDKISMRDAKTEDSCHDLFLLFAFWNINQAGHIISFGPMQSPASCFGGVKDIHKPQPFKRSDTTTDLLKGDTCM